MNKSKTPSTSLFRLSDINLLLLHYWVCSIGLARACAFIAMELYNILSQRLYVPYNAWVLPVLSPRKPEELLCYGLFLCASLIYFILAYPFIAGSKETFRRLFCTLIRATPVRFAVYLTVLLTVNGLTLKSMHSHRWIIVLVPWCFLVVMPVFFAFWDTRDRWHILFLHGDWDYGGYILLGILSLLFLYIFTPYLHGQLEMINEFMDIPEQTQLGTQWVDNTAYINSHGIGGLLKYSPDTDLGHTPLPSRDYYIPFPKTRPLIDFLQVPEISSFGVRVPFIQPNLSDAYYYNDSLHALVINRAMDRDERDSLLQIARNDSEAAAINTLFRTSALHYADQLNKTYSPEEQEFVKKNKFELHWQVYNRWVIHHHNFVLAPINEYALGKPIDQINMQYGFFNVVVMKWLLEKTGGITYQNYFRIWYTFWPIYYFLFILGCFVLLKDIRYVLMTCLITFSAVHLINYKMIFLGPGLNPIRHFFDIGVICLFYLYLKKGRSLLLAASFLLCILQIVNNPQFGHFILGALLATLGARCLSLRRWPTWAETGLSFLAVGTAAFIHHGAHLGTDYMLPYYLAGFVSFPINAKVICTILAIGSLSSLLLLLRYDSRHELQDIAFCLVLYSESAMVYWVWGATSYHFLNLAPIIGLTLVVLYKWGVETTSIRAYARGLTSSIVLVLCLFVYLPTFLFYGFTRYEFHKTFLDHPVYQWNLDKARFLSTANPRYFRHAIDLIRKYSQGHNGIYLISKYDNFLPFLATKYSAMPFFDVPWFLVSPREVNLCIERIQQDQPEFLFADRDILRSLNGEITTRDFLFRDLYDESQMRVRRLSQLRTIFQAVENQYEPVEQSEILMVLKKRKTPLS